MTFIRYRSKVVQSREQRGHLTAVFLVYLPKPTLMTFCKQACDAFHRSLELKRTNSEISCYICLLEPFSHLGTSKHYDRPAYC